MKKSIKQVEESIGNLIAELEYMGDEAARDCLQEIADTASSAAEVITDYILEDRE